MIICGVIKVNEDKDCDDDYQNLVATLPAGCKEDDG